MLYELINPSDTYTFHAPSIEVAGVCVVLLSTGFGARPCEDDEAEHTPILFGWDEWLKDKGITTEWVNSHAEEIADAYDSFLIGNADHRRDIEELLRAIPDETERHRVRGERQERHRSSMNQIGERAYSKAKQFRDIAQGQK